MKKRRQMRVCLLVILSSAIRLPALGAAVEPVAFYAFEEGAGTALHDRSGRDNHGEIDGATWVKGKWGHALQFDGENDSVILPPSESLRMGIEDFSIGAWFRTDRARNNNRLVSPGYLFWELWTNRGALAASIADEQKKDDGSFRKVASSPFAVDDGLWHHAVAAFDRDSDLRLYLDGRQCGIVKIRQYRKLDLPAKQVLMGAHAVGGHRAFAGAIAEVTIYKGVLTAEQVKRRYEEGVLRFLY